MELEQSGPGLGQGRDGGHAAVDPRSRPSLGGNGAGQDDLVVVHGEPAFDQRLGRPRGGPGRGRPAPHEQLQGVDEQRLAGAGLPCERGHAGPDVEGHRLDDPEVPHAQFDEHRLRPFSDRPGGTGRAGWRRSRGARSVTSRAGDGPTRHTTASPGSSESATLPVEHEYGGTGAEQLEADPLLGLEHEGAVEEHVGRDGREHHGAQPRAQDRARGRRGCRPSTPWACTRAGRRRRR